VTGRLQIKLSFSEDCVSFLLLVFGVKTDKKVKMCDVEKWSKSSE